MVLFLQLQFIYEVLFGSGPLYSGYQLPVSEADEGGELLDPESGGCFSVLVHIHNLDFQLGKLAPDPVERSSKYSTRTYATDLPYEH